MNAQHASVASSGPRQHAEGTRQRLVEESLDAGGSCGPDCLMTTFGRQALAISVWAINSRAVVFASLISL